MEDFARLRRRLASMARLNRAGARYVAAWDLDGTLFDNRPRLLRTIHAFGCSHATLADMRATLEETAKVCTLAEPELRAFWIKHYWTEAAFEADIPFEKTVALAKEAQVGGLTNVFITGRIDACRPMTEAQLERVGLNADRLIMKEDLERSTPVFKRDAILRLFREDRPVGVFVTDAWSEIEALQTPQLRLGAPELRCFWHIDRKTYEAQPNAERAARLLPCDPSG